ncbi:MAG: tetratricopeptide repeat protein [Labilithrix sp.]
MRRIGLFASLSVFAYAGLASAQQAPPGTDKSNGQFDLRQNKAGDADVATARGRAAAGDCAGALTSFDQALKTSQEPEVRRDRGMCHDKLGNKFPALEDLRAYLAAKPNAPDSEQIRGRVQQLETELANDRPITKGAKKSASEETDADVYASSRGEQERRRSQIIGAKPGEQEKDYAYYKKQEELMDQANASALRLGHGLVVGAFLGIPRYFIIDGTTSNLSYMAGARVGYSTGRWITLYGELGLSGLTSGAEEQRDRNRNSNTGVLTALGAELRLGLNDRASDQILVRLGVGYEHLVNENNRAVLHLVPGRLGLGYRHVFGPSVGLEVLVDGGPGVAIDENSNTQFFVGIAGNFGIAVGF